MMHPRRIVTLCFTVAALLPVPGNANPSSGDVIPNWSTPPTWSPQTAVGPSSALSSRAAAAAQASSPLPFVGMTPCRIADTRGNGFGGAFGPPPLVSAAPRGSTRWSQCGIPTSAAAVSLNVTVTNTQGPGFLSVYPQGGAIPPVSTLNFTAGQTVANAAVVPIGTGGAITAVAGVSGTDLIIDVNGFYGSPAASPSNLFLGENSGNATLTGTDNTGVGREVLGNDTTGGINTAFGQRALELNTTGTGNSGFGHVALQANPAGNANVALGVQALLADTASDNTAVGFQSLVSHTSGIGNVAVGDSALGARLTTAFNI